MLLAAGNPAEGLAAAEAACAAAPADVHLHRVRAHLLSGLARHRDAVEAARHAVSLAPDDPAALADLARILQAARKLREADKVARRMVALQPGSADAHVLLAGIAADSARWGTARRGYAEALRIDPRHPPARHDLAVVEARLGHSFRALRGLVDAGTLDPTLPQVLANVTAVLWQLAAWLRVLAALCAFGCIMTAGFASDAGLGIVNQPARIAGAVALAAWGGLVWWTVRGVPARARPAVRTVLRADLLLRVTHVTNAVCALLFLSVLVTGFGGLAALVIPLLVLQMVLALVRAARARRSR